MNKRKQLLESWNRMWQERYIVKKFPPRTATILLSVIDLDNLHKEAPITSTFIWGKVGTGKTILAAKMFLKEMQDRYFQHEPTEKCFYVSFAEMVREMKKEFGTKPDFAVIDKYAQCDFLVIDDIFSVMDSDWIISEMYYLLDYRYNHMLTTIITSNEDLVKLGTIIKNARLIRRINDMSDGIIEKQPFKTK